MESGNRDLMNMLLHGGSTENGSQQSLEVRERERAVGVKTVTVVYTLKNHCVFCNITNPENGCFSLFFIAKNAIKTIYEPFDRFMTLY